MDTTDDRSTSCGDVSTEGDQAIRLAGSILGA
jgi:hypothetical protein